MSKGGRGETPARARARGGGDRMNRRSCERAGGWRPRGRVARSRLRRRAYAGPSRAALRLLCVAQTRVGAQQE